MEAARVAALRGHDVTLYEKSKKLGGLLPIAALVKGTEIEDLPAIVRYLGRQIAKLGVKINLGKEVGLAEIEKMKPDVVILATGGVPTTPEINGLHSPRVISSADLHRRLKSYLNLVGPKTLRNLTRYYMPVGKRVVIIGGSINGCELGEFLAKRGREVTIVDTAEILGEGMVDVMISHLFMWFERKGVTLMSGVKHLEITDRGLAVVTGEGEERTIEADSIIPALPLSPDTGLLEDIEGKVPEVYAVGDCREPRLIADAIGEGSRIARSI
jgi:2,4-dienoyl-CoA reductase (NADPH2)